MKVIHFGFMSTARSAAIQRVEDILVLFEAPEPRNTAIALVNTVYPEIREAKQLLGVPEGSIVVYKTKDGITRPLTWRANRLHANAPEGTLAPFRPENILKNYGSLTVVWMP